MVDVTITQAAPIQVQVGENTAAAAAHAADALSAQASAAASAQIAAALSGPLYGSIAAGLSATADQDEFAVDNSDGTVTIYLNNAGSELKRRKNIIDPANAGTAAQLGAAGGGTVQDGLVRTVETYGAVGDGVTDDTAAIQAAIDAGGRIYFGAKTYKVTSLDVTSEATLIGQGWNKTFIDFYTTTDDGIDWQGDSSLNLNSVGYIEHMNLRYQGTGTPNKSGIRLTRKVNMKSVVVDGFSGHGIELVTVSTNTEAPYFCLHESVRSINNGWSGMRIRDNCNANTFVNCQYNSNGQHGVHQELSSLATYNSTFIGGQASYNEQHGYFFWNGTNYNCYGIYAEFNNQSATGADAGDTLNGTYKDLFIGDSVTYSAFHIGSFLNNEIGRVRLNGQSSVQVWQGGLANMGFSGLALGQENVGSGRAITFEGAAGAVHNISFNEATDTIFQLRYDGSPSNPSNEFQLVPSNGGTEGDPIVRARNNGHLAFFNATPVAQPSAIANATGGATVDSEARTALNNLLAACRNLGIIAS